MALVHRLRSGGFVRRWRVWSRSNAQWEVSHGQPDRISEEGVTTGRQGTILAGFRGWTRGLCSRKGLSPPAAESTNAYEVLGVTRHSSQEEIQAAFRALAKATHPDLQPRDAQLSSTASFVRILAAYQACCFDLSPVGCSWHIVTGVLSALLTPICACRFCQIRRSEPTTMRTSDCGRLPQIGNKDPWVVLSHP